MPLISYNDLSAFKIYLNDVGLLRNRYEIDFIIQHKNSIIPIEVKSSENISNTSLKVYNQKYNPKVRIRFSMKNLNKDDNLINIPLFMVEYVDKIINL